MIQPLLSGLLFGSLLSIMIGPVFFTLIQTSLRKGFRAGLLMACGILVGDATYALLVYFGISQVEDRAAFEAGLGLVGGAIMFFFGVFTATRRGERPLREETAPAVSTRHDALRQVLKGLLLNGINPFVLIFWVGIISALSLRQHYTPAHDTVFLIAMLGTVFLTDVLKAYVANQLSRLITATVLTWLNRAAGLGLIFFSFKLLFHAYTMLVEG